MAKKVEVIVAKAARDDLNGILEYIRVDSPRAATKIISEIHRRLESLSKFPKSGRIIPELGDASLREIISGPYRVMYRLEETRMIILRVLHGKRLFLEDF